MRAGALVLALALALSVLNSRVDNANGQELQSGTLAFVLSLLLVGAHGQDPQGLFVTSPGALAGIHFEERVTTDRSFLGLQEVRHAAREVVLVSEEDVATVCEHRRLGAAAYARDPSLLAKYSGKIVLWDDTSSSDEDACDADVVDMTDFERYYFLTTFACHLFNATFIRINDDLDWVGFGAYLHEGTRFKAYVDAGLVGPECAVLSTSQTLEPRTSELLAHLRDIASAPVVASLASTPNPFQRLFDQPTTIIFFRALLPLAFAFVGGRAFLFWLTRYRHREVLKTVFEVHFVLLASAATSLILAGVLVADGYGTTGNFSDRSTLAFRGVFFGVGVGCDVLLIQTFERVLHVSGGKTGGKAAGAVSAAPASAPLWLCGGLGLGLGLGLGNKSKAFTALGLLLVVLDLASIGLLYSLRAAVVAWFLVPLLFLIIQTIVIIKFTRSGLAILRQLRLAQSAAGLSQHGEAQREFTKRLARSLLLAAFFSFVSTLCLALVGLGAGYYAYAGAYVSISGAFLISKAAHVFAQVNICAPPPSVVSQSQGHTSISIVNPKSFGASSAAASRGFPAAAPTPHASGLGVGHDDGSAGRVGRVGKGRRRKEKRGKEKRAPRSTTGVSFNIVRSLRLWAATRRTSDIHHVFEDDDDDDDEPSSFAGSSFAATSHIDYDQDLDV